MGLARRLLGAQAAPGRSMGCAWLGPWAARRLGSRRRLLALSGVLSLPPNFCAPMAWESGLMPDRSVAAAIGQIPVNQETS